MKVVFALNAFKESLAAEEACRAVAAGFRRGCPDVEAILFPVADGGDGTMEALVAATRGRSIARTVAGPLGEPVRARYGLLGDGRTAIVELAKASGLALVPRRRRHPLKTTTFGTGELIADAVGRGVARVIIGLGGSATVDLGAGMAQALGARLLDENGKPIPRGGGGLGRLARIDLTDLRARLEGVEIIGATDVRNPLLGRRGGIQVYSPQKGASPEIVRQLEAGARTAARVLRRELRLDVNKIPGSGAAGGTGAGIVAWLGGRLESGIDVILDAAHFDEAIAGAALVVTGEGRLDAQTRYGKAPAGVAARARAAGIPCLAVAGGIGPGADTLHAIGLTAFFSICNGPLSLDEALHNARRLAESCGEQLARLWAARLG